MRRHSIKHSCLLCMSSVLGNRKPKRFEGFIGIKMWNGFKAQIKDLADRLWANRQHSFFSSRFNTEWTASVTNVSSLISMESTNDLHKRTDFMCTILSEGIRQLGNACSAEDRDAYRNERESWYHLMLDCKNNMKRYIQYCETISDLDKSKTWDTCELAAYLIQNKATKDEAVNFCQEFGAITLQQFREIDRTDIYGDVTTKKDGMSIPIAKQNELDLLLLAMKAKAKVETPRAKLDELLCRLGRCSIHQQTHCEVQGVNGHLEGPTKLEGGFAKTVGNLFFNQAKKNEELAKKNYPSIYTWYCQCFWRTEWEEFLKFTPEEKIAFAIKFEVAKAKYPLLYEYYVGERFWLKFLNWDTQQQTAYAAADEKAGREYDILRLWWAEYYGNKEKWAAFVNMTPEGQRKYAEREQPSIDKKMMEVELNERIEKYESRIYYFQKDRGVEGFDSWSREAKDGYARAHLKKKWDERHR